MHQNYWKRYSILAVLAVLVFGVMACNIPIMRNISLSIGLATHTPDPKSWTATPSATATTTQTATATGTQTATATVTPTAEVAITDTPEPSECNRAEFVYDVNYPDGSSVYEGTYFDKTWRLRNVGTCTWTPSYSVVFTSGYLMGAPYSSSISTTNVKPGQTVDITLPFDAPGTPGSYAGSFYLRAKSGEIFGVGADGTTPFWVRIYSVSYYYTYTPTPSVTPRHHHPHWPPPPPPPTFAPTAAPTAVPTTAVPPTAVPATAVPSDTPVPTAVPT
jgi:hypothetical protein